MSGGREANPYARMQFGEETLNRGSNNPEVFFVYKKPRESPTEPYRADRYIPAAPGGSIPQSLKNSANVPELRGLGGPLTIGPEGDPSQIRLHAQYQSFVLAADGTLWGWGGSGSGELTDEWTGEDTTVPKFLSQVSDVVYLDEAGGAVAAITGDGKVWDWGNWEITGGIPGDFDAVSSIGIPRELVEVPGAVKVAVGSGAPVEGRTFFALFGDGTARCFGVNPRGATGHGSTTTSTASGGEPGRFMDVLLDDIADIKPSPYEHWTAFLKNDGTVWTCGESTFNSLGLNLSDGTRRGTPVQLTQLSDIVQIDVGYRHGLALDSEGRVWAWGDSTLKQFKASGTNSVPALMGYFEDGEIAEVHCGNYYSLFKKTDGSIWTCGYGGNTAVQVGHLGYPLEGGTFPSGYTSFPPLQVDVGDLPIHQVSVGSSHTLAVCDDCTILSWGLNYAGQVGNGMVGFGLPYDRAYPDVVYASIAVDPFPGNVDIRAGGETSTSRQPDGDFYGWGSGMGVFESPRNLAIPLETFGAATDYQLGTTHVVVLRGDGSVWSAGDNTDGQLGDGTYTSRDALVEVMYDAGGDEGQYLAMPQTIQEIATGANRTFARAADGSLWGWGNDASGWLGTGFLMSPPSKSEYPNRIVRQPADPGDLSPPPEDMRPLENITRVWANYGSAWAKDSTGEIWMWGSDNVLAESDTSGGVQVITDSTAPKPLSEYPATNPISSVAEVDFGANHGIVLQDDGTLIGFSSDNVSGAIGTGEGDVGESEVVTPKAVTGVSGVIQIACGEYHTAILLSDGTVWVAGSNSNGQLGDGTEVDHGSEFGQVVGGEQGGAFLVGIQYIAAGGGHTLALDSAGSIWAWGLGAQGQLGNGELVNSNVPVGVGVVGDAVEFTACVPVDGGGGLDEDNPPLDPLLPEMEPVSGIPIPNLNMDVGIDHPPTMDFEIPDFEIPDFDPDFPMPDFHIPDFHMPDFNMPMDGLDFPDFSMDDCFAPMDFGGMCDPMPGTGSGTGGFNTDGTKNRKKGRVRGGGESSRKDTFDTRTCFTGPVYDAIVDLCNDMGLDPESLVIRADCEGVTVDKCFDKGTEKWDALWYMCDLCDAQPIDEGGGLIEITPIFPLPKTHLAHEDGSRGEVPHATTTASYTQPAVDSNVSVTMDSTSILSSNRAVVVEGGGYYKVVSITSGTIAVLKNLGYPGGVTAGTTVAVGKKVMLGGSTAVAPPSTYLTASFTQPAVGSNVTASVGKSGFLVAGDSVEIVLAGFYEVISTPTATTVVLKNKGLAGATAPDALVLGGSQVKKEELATINTTAYTLTTADFTQPAPDATVAIVVGNTGYFDVGEITYITEAGYYEITVITDSTHMTVKNLNYTDSASPTVVIAAGKKVTPEVVEYAALQEGFWPIFTLERDYDSGDMYYAVEVYKVDVDDTGLEVGSIWSKLAIVPGPFSMDPSNIYRIIAPDDMTEAQAEALAIKRARDFGRMSYRVTLTTLYGGSAFRLREKLRLLRPSLTPPLDHTLMIYNITHDISETGKFTILEARFFDSLLVNTEADLAEPPPEEFVIPVEEAA